MASNRDEFEQLLDRYSPRLREAFMAAIETIRSRVVLKRFVERLERGDVQGAIDLIGLDRSAFGTFELALSDTFNGGGIALVEQMKLRDPEGGRASFAFGIRNLIAEQRLRDYSAGLITRITEDQVASIRIALAEGLVRGQNPTKTALDIVGRVSRVSGKREGGILGLSGPQARTSEKARLALLSGDIQGMRDYLALAHRDKRFDAAVRKALAEGKAVKPVDVSRVIGRMNDRQLKFRADKMALNETFEALSMAKDEGIRQAIEAGKVSAIFVTKVWRHSFGDNPRLQHRALNGKEVAYLEPFVMADGTSMMFPHDPKAPVSHKIGCRCRFDIRIDYAAMLAQQRRMALA